ncbi:MAG: hypothetical protein F4Z29_00855 [Gemmatimonadetes bacterium]|nr:hypothetical protein [Gemmatimonadota bacterium]
MDHSGVARLGAARQGMAWQGWAWRGMAGTTAAWRGVAGRGEAGHGLAGRGEAWRGMGRWAVRGCVPVLCGGSWHGVGPFAAGAVGVPDADLP